jgi:thioredoxin 1
LDVKEITSGEELETVKRKALALVDFGAPWCAPCRLQAPIILRLAAQFKGKASVAAANIDEVRDMAAKLGIQSVPTLILFIKGKEVQRFVGLQSEATLSEALRKLCRL